MAYFCKLCGCWHYPTSEIWYRHRKWASKSPKPRKVIRRKKRSFWDRF